MNTTKRYHPALVALHWLSVILMLGAGFLAEDEGGRSPIDIHMILGLLLLAVMLVRLVIRFTTKHPDWADAGSPLLNWIGRLVHLGLYLSVFFILGMGAWTAYNRNLIGYLMGTGTVFGRAGFISAFHHLGWILALGLIMLHVGASLYHQILLKDNLMARMWFGK